MKRSLTLVCCAVLGQLAWGQAGLDLVSAGDALYNRWGVPFELATYRAQLTQALALWERALDVIPAEEAQVRAQVLVRLSRGYFELAEAYLAVPKEKEEAYRKGKDYALAVLRLDPEFARIEKEQGHRAALTQASHAAALFWYGNNLGRWLGYNWFQALGGGTRDVLACFTRAAELDEAYWGGGPRRALGNFLAQTPGFLGGDLDAAAWEFARAIELDPNFIQNYVDYAEVYAKPRGDRALYCQLLGRAAELAAQEAVFTAWPLYNALTLARVDKLMASPPGGGACK